MDKLIAKFLREHFPVVKLKKGKHKHFKRGINIPGTFTGTASIKCYLGDRTDIEILYQHLHQILGNVFGVGYETIIKHLYPYLNLTRH